MRIAVFADTHDRYPPELPELLRPADEIWHLGDVCAPETLVEFTLLGKPLHVVRGNNDDHPEWPYELRLERGGFRFCLIHIPPRQRPADATFILHGHTHVPRDELDIHRCRWLNPGCISYPRGQGRSFAWLHLGEGRLRWEIVALA